MLEIISYFFHWWR